MTVVRDEKRKVYASVVQCKQCQALVYWGISQRGKRVKFAVDREGEQFIASRDVHDEQACSVHQALNALEAGGE